MTRPVVGITSYLEPASWGPWRGVPVAFVHERYVRVINGAGARCVVLPPDPVDADVLRILDALVIAGGPDVDPGNYGAPRHPLTDSRPDRDRAELALLAAALAADLPVLGVCRGMQLLTVAYGGSLHQHLPEVIGDDRHQPAPAVYGTHRVRFAPGSRIAGIMAGDGEVNSYHHQGVADPGRLTVTGWADDGVVEVAEDPAKRFVLGVQWHPEYLDDVRLFRALVAAAG
ncbi:gamma-glutamyl-gamma-aminobutyrate hydrolase family protein [Rhizomonospora bruguierae]|uniref:gamma-glutamyl-gamma-aminobutyrate hydrolase family protein n=1 Tax=Rhizomonospora bruguierae TaxID=1581705 RepID=UPI001BCD82C1|nr:gamma-glutamyl-gamma-aminobutyrate hydrolase family protein [Micromonospora sp. NBRC 107566]